MSIPFPRTALGPLLALLLIPWAALAEAEPNFYGALQQFLSAAGYWTDEAAVVLDPLDGELTYGNGTADVHLIAMMDDIPGLRPLPDGVIEFIHDNPDVFYLAVGRDRLLVGVTLKAGPTPRYQFEKFDLIEGGSQVVASPGGTSSLTPFLLAHGRYLAPVFFLFVMGTAVMAFLAVRLRRRAATGTDNLLAVLRRAVDARVYLVAGASWLGMLAALYGLMHFTGRYQTVAALAAGSQVSYRLADTVGFQPEHLRLVSFITAMGAALAVVVVLGFWSGAVLARSERPRRKGERP